MARAAWFLASALVLLALVQVHAVDLRHVMTRLREPQVVEAAATTAKGTAVKCETGGGGESMSCGPKGLKCPHADGVCCRGGDHCCPRGYHCGRAEGESCPFCIKSGSNTCPGKATKAATGLHNGANKKCGGAKEEAEGGQQGEGREKADNTPKKEQPRPLTPEDRRNIRSCKAFWAKDPLGCPHNTLPRGGVMDSDCSGEKDSGKWCGHACCMSSTRSYNCGNFYFENGCGKAGRDALSTPHIACSKADGSCATKCCKASAGRKEDKKTIERPPVEERIEKKEEERPNKEEEKPKEEERPEKDEEKPPTNDDGEPEEDKEEQNTCAVWWRQHKGCPDNMKQTSTAASVKCKKQECMKQCCHVPKPAVFTCGAFLEKNECPGQMMENVDNKDSQCKKDECLKTCCKEPPKTTCKSFWNDGNNCPPKTMKAHKNANANCDGRACANLCCEDIPRCQDWIDDGNKCEEGLEVNDEKKEFLCGDDPDKCKSVCCKKIPPKPITCEQFWGGSRCAAGLEPHDAHKLNKCVKDECQKVCCHRPPPTCDNWLDKHECPSEWVEIEANKNRECEGRGCLTVCCRQLPPTCTRWFEKHQCTAPLIHDKTKLTTRCTLQQCPTTCCKKPPPHHCSHWWAKNDCPRVRPKKNTGNTNKECKGNQCMEMCCSPPPPPPPTCQLAWWKEHCEAKKLLRRNENAFHKCHGEQCTSVCCKPPPPFHSQPRRCYWTGDPHWGTWDGARFDMYEQGEWVMYKDKYDNEQINSLTRKFHRNPRPSYTMGVAMRSGKDVIAMMLKDELQNWNPQLYVNGKLMPWRRGAKYTAGTRLTVEVLWQNGMPVHGSLFKIYSNSKPGPATWCTGWSRARYFSFLNCYASLKGWYNPPQTLGFCGRADNNGGNDFNLPDGTLLASAGGARQHNANRMAAGWRVQANDSLFALREAHFKPDKGGKPVEKLTPLKAANGNTALVARAFGECHKVEAQLQCMIDYIEGMKQEAVKDAVKAAGKKPVQQQN